MSGDILLQNETCSERVHCHPHQPKTAFCSWGKLMSNKDSAFPPKIHALIFEI